MRVYFDNASTTPLLDEVKQVMTQVINETYGNPSSIHLHGRQARIIVEEARKKIAHGINASTGEIFFTSGATEANNMVLLRSVKDLGVERIITSNIEHHCILHTLDYMVQEKMVEVVTLNVNSQGEIELSELEALLKEDKKTLVSIMHGNNEIGTLADIAAMGALCNSYNALLHTDTAQTMGKIHIDVMASGVHFLCGASHKFYGPKGVGFVFVKADNIIQPMMYGGDQERGMRSGTENIYGIAGMAKAFELACEQMAERESDILSLRNYFLSRMHEELEDIHLNGSPNGLPNIISISFPPTSKSEMMMMNLDIRGIAASSGSACSSGVENDSHVLQAIGHDPALSLIHI